MLRRTKRHALLAIRKKSARGNGPKVEFIIDQVDGKTATSKGKKDAISAFRCPPGCLQVLPDDGHYFKVATDGKAKGKINLGNAY